MNSHRVVGLQYSSGVPHLKLNCYQHKFRQTNKESLSYIRCILTGNWQGGTRLNFESFDDYVRFLWHVNGVDWASQSGRQRAHLISLRSRVSPYVGDFVSSRLFPCARTEILRLPPWLLFDSFPDSVKSEPSEVEHEMVDDSTSTCSELSEQSVYT